MPTLQQRPNWRAKKGSVAFTPPLLVDQVAAPDTNLSGHSGVLWYNTVPAAFSTMVADDAHGPKEWWAQTSQIAETYGPGATIVSVPTYGVNAMQFGSAYSPDHYSCQDTLYGTKPPCTDGQTIMSYRKWINASTLGTEAGFSSLTVQTGSLTQGYLRYMLKVNSDVATGMTETGMKLSGFESGELDPNLRAVIILWYAKPVAGRCQLHRYMNSATYGAEFPSTGLGYYLNLDQWHSLEIFSKLNTDISTADGELRIWLDDVLIYENTGFKWFDTLPAGVTREIGQVRGQIFHGGTVATPTQSIHHTTFGYCLATRRIGAARTV